MYVTVDGMPEEVQIETLDSIETAGNGGAERSRGASGGKKSRRATRPGDVTTSMPGTIIDVLVAEGDKVEAGQPVLVLEAMKMESEIAAPVSGTVTAVNITKGAAANPDDALIEIDGDDG